MLTVFTYLLRQQKTSIKGRYREAILDISTSECLYNVLPNIWVHMQRHKTSGRLSRDNTVIRKRRDKWKTNRLPDSGGLYIKPFFDINLFSK